MHPYALENWLQQVEVTDEPLARGSQQPDSVLPAPARFPVNLPKLAFLASDQRSDSDGALSCVPNKLVDVGLGDDRLVLVVD
jgi:hypothetical protein